MKYQICRHGCSNRAVRVSSQRSTRHTQVQQLAHCCSFTHQRVSRRPTPHEHDRTFILHARHATRLHALSRLHARNRTGESAASCARATAQTPLVSHHPQARPRLEAARAGHSAAGPGAQLLWKRAKPVLCLRSTADHLKTLIHIPGPQREHAEALDGGDGAPPRGSARLTRSRVTDPAQLYRRSPAQVDATVRHAYSMP